MYGQQQYNPLSLFIILGMLSIAPPKTINQHLESLSFALDATSKSMESLKQGMDTFNTGLQQLHSPAGTAPDTNPGAGEGNNMQENNFQENNFHENNYHGNEFQESNSQKDSFNTYAPKDTDDSFSVMPINEPDINLQNANDKQQKQT